MSKRITSPQQIAESHLCTGCGACAFIAPDHIQMVDTLRHGRRPHTIGNSTDLRILNDACQVCPGLGQVRQPELTKQAIPELLDTWGPILEIWEGYASDRELRYKGSSGGVTTALALFCIERGGMEGVVHVRARSDAPLLNETVFSRNRKSLIAGTGSRYAPASPCDGLSWIESASKPCVFIGKPCDIAGAASARRMRDSLDRNLGLTLAIFCAGTPAVSGTLEMAQRLGVDDPTQITSIQYRGNGWPGQMSVTWQDPNSGESITSSMTYEEAWGGILQKHRQWRCRVCADHTGELADLSIGDPWYRPSESGDPGRSLVLVRTENGRRILREAIEAGYVQLQQRDPWVLAASQPHLLQSQQNIWGRLFACKLLGLATPRYYGMRLARLWKKHLTWRKKLQSIGGTARRIFSRQLRRLERSDVFEPLESLSCPPSQSSKMACGEETTTNADHLCR